MFDIIVASCYQTKTKKTIIKEEERENKKNERK